MTLYSHELTHLLFPYQGTESIPITVWHIESIIGVVEAHPPEGVCAGGGCEHGHQGAAGELL